MIRTGSEVFGNGKMARKHQHILSKVTITDGKRGMEFRFAFAEKPVDVLLGITPKDVYKLANKTNAS
jgi:hypothetical protein